MGDEPVERWSGAELIREVEQNSKKLEEPIWEQRNPYPRYSCVKPDKRVLARLLYANRAPIIIHGCAEKKYPTDERYRRHVAINNAIRSFLFLCGITTSIRCIIKGDQHYNITTISLAFITADC